MCSQTPPVFGQAEAGCPLKVHEKRSLPDCTNNAGSGCEDQLRDRVEQQFESPASKKLLVQPKSDKSQIEVGGRLAGENMDQSKDAADCASQLCNLPDDLLLRILCFLPLKDAVKTSVLCKRWGHLWALVPDLRFSCYFFPMHQRPLFMELVRRACALRRGSFIRSFSLSYYEMSDVVSEIKEMITSFVTTCGMQDLRLDLLNCGNAYTLPSSIFSCGTLEMLRVRSRCIIKIPYPISLSNLKVLILQDVIFEDDDSVEKLFSSPLLETLEISYCNWMKCKSINIFAPKLQHLTIYSDIEPGDDISNERQVQIDAAGLKSFHCEGMINDEYCILGDTTRLVEAKLLYAPSDIREEVIADIVVARNVKLLWFVSNVLANRDDVPLFGSLIKLRMVGEIDSVAVEGLFAVLRGSPRLRSLYFTREFFYYPVNGRHGLLDPMPSCFLSDLKEISVMIAGSVYNQKQLFMVGLFLETVVALEEMTIRFLEDHVDCEVLLEDLSKFPLASEKCRITFQPQQWC
ncbi:hypothetical protein CDL15_Pgr024684 [Punica granatum]|uniref:F-box domain-containing protein n=1 Tax=Punica granatum TaxID=22663 RepID=A0A218W502_PUNGR|nr:hypothetical protein CDL15_Pgr024684 [Punica granatum]